MFDINDFVATMNDVVLTAEENDIGMFELVEIAADYIKKNMEDNEMKKIYDLKEKDTFIKDVEAKIFKDFDVDVDWVKENDIVISVGNMSIELPINADTWSEICTSLAECYEMETPMSKLEKDGRGFWNYTSKSGVVYDVDEASADFNIITDVFKDYWDNENDIYISDKLIDYVFGDLETDADEIKDWIDNRIEFYEKHERMVRWYRDNKAYKSYIGTEEPKEWNEPEEVSVDEMF